VNLPTEFTLTSVEDILKENFNPGSELSSSEPFIYWSTRINSS